VIGVPCAVSDIDVGTATVEDISEIRSTFSSRVLSAGEFTGWGGWFDVQFRGSAEQPANEVELSTAPPSQTHWGQQVFLAAEVQMVEVDDMIDTRVLLTRQASNHRLLNLELSYSISRPGQGLLVPEVTVKYKID
jgi:protein arginine N-methyltransferase 1